MKKLLIYYNFIIVTLLILSGFIGATNMAQLTSAILFFPLAAYFFVLVLPNRNKALIFPKPQELKKIKKKKVKKSEVIKAEKVEDELGKPKDFDLNRRAFVKLIGSAGVTVFLFSLFTKRAHGAFFGSVPGPGTVALKDTSGTQIDPAEKLPTDGYKINQIDDSSPAYYGFVDKDGDWFIMKETSTGDYRYYKKQVTDDVFSIEWANRATLSPYGYFDEIF